MWVATCRGKTGACKKELLSHFLKLYGAVGHGTSGATPGSPVINRHCMTQKNLGKSKAPCNLILLVRGPIPRPMALKLLSVSRDLECLGRMGTTGVNDRIFIRRQLGFLMVLSFASDTAGTARRRLLVWSQVLDESGEMW